MTKFTGLVGSNLRTIIKKFVLNGNYDTFLTVSKSLNSDTVISLISLSNTQIRCAMVTMSGDLYWPENLADQPGTGIVTQIHELLSSGKWN